MGEPLLKVNRKELAEALLYLAKKGVADFSRNVAEKTGIRQADDDAQMAWVVEEAIILLLWVISKMLPHEKDLLDAVHDRHLDYFRSHKITPEAIELYKAKVTERYERYYGAWDDSAGSNQQFFGDEIVKCLLGRGQPIERSPDVLLTFTVISGVFTFMRVVLKSRSRFEITPE